MGTHTSTQTSEMETTVIRFIDFQTLPTTPREAVLQSWHMVQMNVVWAGYEC